MAGLQAIGYRVVEKPKPDPTSQDVLVVWNRHRNAADADRYEAAGGKVIVAENGYIGRDATGWQLYALARSYHNGAGRWFVGDENRWSSLGVKLKPWRKDGKHVLVLPQRGIGPAGVAMPRDWPLKIEARLRKVTSRKVIVRAHPGQERPSLKPDLANCWAVVTWGSGAAIKAIVAGIPVFHDMPQWIGAPAARYGIDHIEDPALCDRAPMLHRLSYAQWTCKEISTGEPLRSLLAI